MWVRWPLWCEKVLTGVVWAVQMVWRGRFTSAIRALTTHIDASTPLPLLCLSLCLSLSVRSHPAGLTVACPALPHARRRLLREAAGGGGVSCAQRAVWRMWRATTTAPCWPSHSGIMTPTGGYVAAPCTCRPAHMLPCLHTLRSTLHISAQEGASAVSVGSLTTDSAAAAAAA